MARINAKGYIERRSSCAKATGKRRKTVYRDWFMVKPTKSYGNINVRFVCFPSDYIGKKVRFKFELIDDDFKDKPKKLCQGDRDWLLGIIGSRDYTNEVIEWIEQDKMRFEQ